MSTDGKKTTDLMETNSALKNEQLKILMNKVATERCRQSFEQLFDHFAPLLVSYSLARDPGAKLQADELAQQVLIKLWNKAHTYKPEKAAVSTWIFTLARNTRIDNMRRNGRFNMDINADDLFMQIEDNSISPFENLKQQRAQEMIADSLKQLPREQSQVLGKVYLEGKSHQETADELDLPLGTVKSRVRLALKKMSIIVN